MPTINRKQIVQPTIEYKHDNQSAKFYSSKAWRLLRSSYYATHPLCERCLLNNKTTPTTEIHHIKPFLSGRDENEQWQLLLDERNLQAVCSECHDEIHAQMKHTHTSDMGA